jgi:hypothetical protein
VRSGFFAAPEAQVAVSDLKELKKRCRQTARSLWYDWRHTLEDDTSRKLAASSSALEEDLAHLEQLNSQAQQAEQAIAHAMPPAHLADAAAAAAAASRDAANRLAFRQAAAAQAKSSQFALQQQLLAAEQELLNAKGAHRAQQARLSELHAAVAAQSNPSKAEGGTGRTLSGDALLDALDAATCWRPLSLTSSMVIVGEDRTSPALLPSPDAHHLWPLLLLNLTISGPPSEPHHLWSLF